MDTKLNLTMESSSTGDLKYRCCKGYSRNIEPGALNDGSIAINLEFNSAFGQRRQLTPATALLRPVLMCTGWHPQVISPMSRMPLPLVFVSQAVIRQFHAALRIASINVIESNICIRP